MYNFLETFFFISLGITFILIALLVYHFKHRISTVEQKTDTLFEIMNNIVKELSILKDITTNRMTTQCSSSFTNQSNSFVCDPSPIKLEKIVVSDDESDSYVSDEDDEVTNSEDDDDDNDDNDSEDNDTLMREPVLVDVNGPVREIAPTPTQLSNATGDLREETKFLDVNVPIPVVEDIKNSFSIETANVSTPDQEISSTQDLQVVEPLTTGSDTTTTGPVMEALEDIQDKSPILQEANDFSSWNLKELREYAVSNNIVSDSSKYNKKELLKMIIAK